MVFKFYRSAFSLQTTLITREKQLEAWCQLVIDYCQYYKIYTIDIADIANTELFVNTTLNRKLSTDGIRAVFDCLEHKRKFSLGCFTLLRKKLLRLLLLEFFLGKGRGDQ